jgi:hypothetical protein
MNKVKIHKFWIPAESSVGTSKHKLFVAKADFDRAIKWIKELEAKPELDDAFFPRYTPLTPIEGTPIQ